jgi:ABC-type multidrug transport system fused ATPase/permease subunit
MDFYRIFHSVTRDCLSIGLIVSAAPIQLATFNLMLSIMTSFGMNLSNLTMYCDIIGCIYLPKIQAYFRCLDMRLPPPPSALSRVLKRQDAGFDLQGVNITFCYPHQSEPAEETKQKDDIPVTAGKPVLENLSFHFEAGKMHALVGDNGSGKSTLVQLITQLYDTHAGTIYLNGYDIKQYRVSEIRSHMSVMFQDIAKLFRFSVLENIGLGDTSLLSTDPAKIEAVAKQHHVTDFISVDTVIGDLYQVHKDPDEKWQAELSGGQWQKIALARTFIKAQDADLIILDEPTSALDAEAEYQFFQQLRTLRKDKTTIFITHKYVTTATADCIHFMKGGRIVERGSHAELMASQGEYAKRYRFQTQGYNEK